jgi:hypothetical protein
MSTSKATVDKTYGGQHHNISFRHHANLFHQTPLGQMHHLARLLHHRTVYLPPQIRRDTGPQTTRRDIAVHTATVVRRSVQQRKMYVNILKPDVDQFAGEIWWWQCGIQLINKRSVIQPAPVKFPLKKAMSVIYQKTLLMA